MLPAFPNAKSLFADKGYDADWFETPWRHDMKVANLSDF